MDFKRKPIKLTWGNINEIVNKILKINSITMFTVDKEKGEIETYSEYHDHYIFGVGDEIIIGENGIYPSSEDNTVKYTGISLTTHVDWLYMLEESYNVDDWSIRSVDDKRIITVVTDRDTVSCDLESAVIVFDNKYRFVELFSSSGVYMPDAMEKHGYIKDKPKKEERCEEI